MNQSEQVAHFRQLHAKKPLVLPNAWDAASARVIEAAGAPAIATTSAGISWSFGRWTEAQARRDVAGDRQHCSERLCSS
jgi:2-methylisocitrate lyase-like PEP mutase family enzyme